MNTKLKNGVFIGVIAALLIAAVFAVKSLFSGTGPLGRLVDWVTGNDEATKEQKQQEVNRQKQQVEQTNNDLETHQAQFPLSYTESEYMRMANSIYKAADGWTEDDVQIYNEVKKCKNVSDYEKLIVVFDVRTLSKFSGKVSVDLKTLLSDYLDNDCKYWLNNYFAKIGIEAIG